MRAPVAQCRHLAVAVTEENDLVAEHGQPNEPATDPAGLDGGIPVFAETELGAVVERPGLRAAARGAMRGLRDVDAGEVGAHVAPLARVHPRRLRPCRTFSSVPA